MSDLMKGYGAGSEVAGRPTDGTPVEETGWFVQDSDAADIDAWIAFKRGEEPSSLRGNPQAAKRPRPLIGLRKRGRH